MSNHTMSDHTASHHHHAIEYRWRLSRAEVDQVLHYTHWIPNTRGFTERFFAHQYPGGSLGTFVAAFRAAGILLSDHHGTPHGGRCHWRVRWIYFSDATSWAVEWDDDVTADDGMCLWRGPRTALPVDLPSETR